MNIVIVIPTKNEADNLKKLSSSIKKTLRNINYKLCFVDGSETIRIFVCENLRMQIHPAYMKNCFFGFEFN